MLLTPQLKSGILLNIFIYILDQSDEDSERGSESIVIDMEDASKLLNRDLGNASYDCFQQLFAIQETFHWILLITIIAFITLDSFYYFSYSVRTSNEF